MYKTSPIAGLPSTINDNRNNIHFVYCRKSNLYMYVVICIIQTCDIYNNKQDCVQLIVIQHIKYDRSWTFLTEFWLCYVVKYNYLTGHIDIWDVFYKQSMKRINVCDIFIFQWYWVEQPTVASPVAKTECWIHFVNFSLNRCEFFDKHMGLFKTYFSHQLYRWKIGRYYVPYCTEYCCGGGGSS